MSEWADKAAERAGDTILHFEDSIVDAVEKGHAIHRTSRIFGESVQLHIQDYSGVINISSREAVCLLEELGDHESTDSSSWQCEDSILDALLICAKATFVNAVEHHVNNIFDQINSDEEIGEYDSLDADERPNTKREFITDRLKEIIDEALGAGE